MDERKLRINPWQSERQKDQRGGGRPGGERIKHFITASAHRVQEQRVLLPFMLHGAYLSERVKCGPTTQRYQQF
jgi:hypothetical protein